MILDDDARGSGDDDDDDDYDELMMIYNYTKVIMIVIMVMIESCWSSFYDIYHSHITMKKLWSRKNCTKIVRVLLGTTGMKGLMSNAHNLP